MNEQAFVQQYSTQEKLLLAQAVHKLGAAKWEGISQLLMDHPCMADKTPEAREEMWNPKACEEAYVGLMTDIGINVPAEGGILPAAKPHLRLAQTFYYARMAELKDSIATYEQRFSTLMSEIQMIKTGEMDGAIGAELRAVLVKKFGKKLLDAWVPEQADVVAAAEAGEVGQGEREERDGKRAAEKKAASEAESVRVQEAAAEEEKRKAAEAKAETEAQAEAQTEVMAEKERESTKRSDPSPLVSYSSPPQSPDPAPTSPIPTLDVIPEDNTSTVGPTTTDELLLPPHPRRKKGGRSQKGVSMEKDVTAAEEVSEETATATAIETEGSKRPKRGSITADAALPTSGNESDSVAVAPEDIKPAPIPAPAQSRSTRRGRTPAAPPTPKADTSLDDVEMAGEAAPTPAAGRSTRKGRTQTPAPEPVPTSEGEDVEMAEPEESTIEALAEVEEVKAPSRDNRRKSTKPAAGSRSNQRQSTPPVAPPFETKASSASPLTSEPGSASPPAEVPAGGNKPNPRSKAGRATAKRNSRGNKEVEVEAEEEEEVPVADETTPGPSKRGGNKRKAPVQPSGAPAGKRRVARKGTSPAPTVVTIPDSEVEMEDAEEEAEEEGEAEEEVEEEEEVKVEPETGRRKGRKSMPAPLVPATSAATRRGRAPKESPGLSARTKGSSPSVSRRAVSVASEVSAATPVPAPGKRGRGRPSKGKAPIVEAEEKEAEEDAEDDEEPVEELGDDEVLVEDEDDDEEEEGEAEEQVEPIGGRAARSSARNRGMEVEVAVSAGAPEGSTNGPTKRSSQARKSRAEDNVEVDMSAPSAKRNAGKKAEATPAETKRSTGRKGRGEVEVEEPTAVEPKKSGGRRGKVEPLDQSGATGRPKRESRGQARLPSHALGPEESEPRGSTAGSLSLSPRKERATPAASEGAPSTSRPSLGTGGGSRRRRNDETPEQRDKKMVVKLLMGLLDTISAHKNGNVFQNPVKKNDAPDYFEIVKQPMDLKTMRLKIRDGQISTLDEFERDLHLIFTNAMMYNEDESQVFAMAEEMLKDAEGHLAHFRLMQQDLGR